MTAEYEGRLFIDGEFREAQSGQRFEVINAGSRRAQLVTYESGNLHISLCRLSQPFPMAGLTA